MKKKTIWIIVAVIVILGIIGAAVGGNNSDSSSQTQSSVSENNASQSKDNDEKQEEEQTSGDGKSAGMDGTIKGDNFDISIVDVKWTNALETSIGTVTPEDEGKGLLCIIFSAKNTTDSTQNVANAGFNAYIDGKKVLPKVVAGTIDDAMVFVGAVSSGKEMVGYSVWELPEDWKEFQTSYIDSGTAIESDQYFVIHKEDIQ